MVGLCVDCNIQWLITWEKYVKQGSFMASIHGKHIRFLLLGLQPNSASFSFYISPLLWFMFRKNKSGKIESYIGKCQQHPLERSSRFIFNIIQKIFNIFCKSHTIRDTF